MTRREADASALSALDKLLLSQAVYEVGANAWNSVAKLLSKHPLLGHRKSFFTAQSCQAFYKTLRAEAALEITEADNAIRAPQNLRLAQIHFHSRLLELKAQIGEEEDKFKKVVAEIDQIRSSQQKTSHPNKEDAAKDVQEDKKTETEVTSLPEHEPTSLTPAPALSEDDASGDTETTEEKGEVEDEEPKSAVPVGSPQDIDMDALLVPEPETPAAQDEQPATEAQVPAPHQVESDQQPEDVHVEAEPQDIPNDSDAPSQADAGPSTNMDVDKAPTPPADSPKPPPPSPKQEPPDTTEPTIDPNATEDEISSGDEPLHVQRSRRGRRGRPSISGNRPTRNRRQTRTADPAPSETGTPEREVRDEAESPAADTQQSKRQGKRRASFVEDDSRDKKRSRDESEPVEEEESGPASTSRARKRGDGQSAAKKFQNVIGMLHSQISQHRNGTIFHNPIKDSEAPDYHDIVKRPMDLKTIKTRIKDGAISNSLEFQRDVYQMFANAMMYNRPGSDVYVMTEDMMLDCESYIQTYRQTEGFVRGSQR